MHSDQEALALAERAALNVALRAALLCYLAGVQEGGADAFQVSVQGEDGLTIIDITESHAGHAVAGYSL